MDRARDKIAVNSLAVNIFAAFLRRLEVNPFPIRGYPLIIQLSTIGAFVAISGCEVPPKNVPVATIQAPPPRTYPLDYAKPFPADAGQAPPAPAFDDVPLVDTRLPEETWFVDAYNRVGKPRIAIFVNRSLDGGLIAAQPQPEVTSQTVQQSTGSVDVSSGQGNSSGNYWGGSEQHNDSSFKSTGPAEYTQTNTSYLQPGQYDAADLQALDYQEIESLLTDWIGSRGQLTVLAPDFVRSRLSDQQLKDLQSGKGSALNDVGQSTQADILIQIQAHPTRRQGQLVILLVGQAVNIRGGESIAQASVEMPTPIDRGTLNNFTRFLSRKLIHGMVGTWATVPAPTPAAPEAPTAPSAPAAPTVSPAPVTAAIPAAPTTAPSTQP